MFNDIEENMWDDEEFDNYDEIDRIDYEYEVKAIGLFSKKQKEELKELLEEISEEYFESQYLHILALYKILNNENAKEIIEKSFRMYEEKKLIFHPKIAIFLVYALTKYYKDKKILEKFYTYILKISYMLTDTYSGEILDEVVDCVLESREWLINNLDLNYKEKTIINSIALLVLENTFLLNEKDKNAEKFLRNYVSLLWELREFIDIEKTFAPLFKGVGWSYIKIKAKNDEDMINYFVSLGLDENIAKELLEMYLKYNEDDNSSDDLDIDIPF